MQELPSLVMNEMNSLTHSCMHSLASFAIFAFSGRAVFMIRATGAKLRMLASDATLLVLLEPLTGGDADDSGEDDMAAARRALARHRRAVIRTFGEASARSRGSGHAETPTGAIERRADGQLCAQIKAEGGTGDVRTIGDWKPSVLFLDLEFVPESLRLCILSVPVHMMVVVRRLRWFHTVLLWRGGRHVYSGSCRGRFRRRGCVCAGGLHSDLLASTSQASTRQAV